MLFLCRVILLTFTALYNVVVGCRHICIGYMDFSGCIERNRDVNIFDVPKYKFDVLNLLSHWLIRMMYLDSRTMLCQLVHHSLINYNFHFMYFSDLIGLKFY